MCPHDRAIERRSNLQWLLARNADDVSATRLIAHSYLAQRDYKQAERFYSRAAGLKPGNARIRSDLSNVRTLQKNDDEVLREARRILKSPDRRVQGLRLLLRLADRSPNNARAYVALADGFAAAKAPKRKKT